MGKKVIIIGAGIGGLATANLLAKAGYDVSIYEKNAQAGGRAGQINADGFIFDTGPSWYLMPDVFKHYYGLIGENVDTHLALTKLSPAYKVFYETDAPITVTGHEKTDVQTFESIESGAGNALTRYINTGEAAYRLSIQYFLYTNFQSFQEFIKLAIVRRALIMTRLAFTPIDRYVARFVQDRRLQQILEYPTVFLGSSPFEAPALYSLMSALDFREGVFYPRGGIYEIIKSLVHIGENIGVKYYYNTNVTSIETLGKQVQGIRLDDTSFIPAKIIVSNADLHFTETKLLPTHLQSFPESYWTKRTPGPSALLMYLGIKGALPDLEHHNLLFVDAWRENFDAIYRSHTVPHPASIYVCNPSKTDNSVAPKGHENLFVLVPLPAGVLIDAAQLTDLSDKYLDQISTMIHVPDLKKRIVYQEFIGPDHFANQFNSWQSTALGASHVLRQSAIFRTPNKSRKVNGLYYVGANTVPGIGLPMCLIGAELVYKRIIGVKRGGKSKPVGGTT